MGRRLSVCPYCHDDDGVDIPPGVDVVECNVCGNWWGVKDGEPDAALTSSLAELSDALEPSSN